MFQMWQPDVLFEMGVLTKENQLQGRVVAGRLKPFNMRALRVLNYSWYLKQFIKKTYEMLLRPPRSHLQSTAGITLVD